MKRPALAVVGTLALALVLVALSAIGVRLALGPKSATASPQSVVSHAPPTPMTCVGQAAAPLAVVASNTPTIQAQEQGNDPFTALGAPPRPGPAGKCMVVPASPTSFVQENPVSANAGIDGDGNVTGPVPPAGGVPGQTATSGGAQ